MIAPLPPTPAPETLNDSPGEILRVDIEGGAVADNGAGGGHAERAPIAGLHGSGADNHNSP